MKRVISVILRPHARAIKGAEQRNFPGLLWFPLVYFGTGIVFATIGLILNKLPENTFFNVLLTGSEIFAGLYFTVLFVEFSAVLFFKVKAKNTPLSKLRYRRSGEDDGG